MVWACNSWIGNVQLLFLSQAQKDAKKLSASGLKPIASKLLELIQLDPLAYPPAFEYLKGEDEGIEQSSYP